ncbi:MAG: Sua5/YciO/YrdC/YwlC family protein, partial [Rikenellaceae bacterium]
KTIGARIADNAIARAIVESLGAPIFTTSLKSVDEVEYIVDPELIHEQWGRQVDIVIDGGIGLTTPTTIVDISDGDVEVVREGEAELK